MTTSTAFTSSNISTLSNTSTLETVEAESTADEFSAGVVATRDADVSRAVIHPRENRENVHPENPYRPGTSYAVIFQVLYREKDGGITKSALIEEVTRLLGKDRRLVKFATAIVISPNADGSANGSAKANHYWVDRRPGGRLYLHMRRAL